MCFCVFKKTKKSIDLVSFPRGNHSMLSVLRQKLKMCLIQNEFCKAIYCIRLKTLPKGSQYLLFFTSLPKLYSSLSLKKNRSRTTNRFMIISHNIWIWYFSIVRCIIKGNYIFYGGKCEHNVSRITTILTTQDPVPVSKLTIIAISGGTGGALLLIILISTTCFCYRLKQAKRKG